MTTSSIIIVMLLLGLIIWWIASWKINHVDSPRYMLTARKKDYEIRTYEPYIVAETIVEGSRRSALSAGFRILAKYIFGDNSAKTALAMTAPVGERPSADSRAIAMNAPVMTRDNSNSSHVISFVMPRTETMTTLPQPLDSRIVLNTVPSQTVAVMKFSWYATESRIQAKKDALKSALIRDGVIMQGSISYAGYTAPFTIPFLEKHEVMVVVQG